MNRFIKMNNKILWLGLLAVFLILANFSTFGETNTKKPCNKTYVVHDCHGEWPKYKSRYNKTYVNIYEEAFRKGLFCGREMHQIIEYKKACLDPGHGAGGFADYTIEELDRRVMKFTTTAKYKISD